MAKRKAGKRKQTGTRRAAKPAARKRTKKAAPAKRAAARRPAKVAKKAGKVSSTGRTSSATKIRKPSSASSASRDRRPAPRKAAPPKPSRLERERRTLDDVPSPPSSLNMLRRGSAVRTGRAEVAENIREHGGMTRAITGGDVDVDVEDAYFTGDEAPGGDNPTPDQDVVDDIGKALGVEYQDNEELKAVDKVIERDRKRWELDPASSEDYKDRK
jgi:hypothetical protein